MVPDFRDILSPRASGWHEDGRQAWVASVAPADPRTSHTSPEERISVDEGQLGKLNCQGYR
jgi:hypothetical protein